LPAPGETTEAIEKIGAERTLVTTSDIRGNLTVLPPKKNLSTPKKLRPGIIHHDTFLRPAALKFGNDYKLNQ